jgi:hypothetical protein
MISAIGFGLALLTTLTLAEKDHTENSHSYRHPDDSGENRTVSISESIHPFILSFIN